MPHEYLLVPAEFPETNLSRHEITAESRSEVQRKPTLIFSVGAPR